VREVLERVPLGAGLRVDVDLVVHADEVDPVDEVDGRLGEGLAGEARVGYVVEGPVELDGFAGLDLGGGGALDEGGLEEVEGWGKVCLLDR
jgi:hypothetical protein